jgi:hypothetical protein
LNRVTLVLAQPHQQQQQRQMESFILKTCHQAITKLAMAIINSAAASAKFQTIHGTSTAFGKAHKTTGRSVRVLLVCCLLVHGLLRQTREQKHWRSV